MINAYIQLLQQLVRYRTIQIGVIQQVISTFCVVFQQHFLKCCNKIPDLFFQVNLDFYVEKYVPGDTEKSVL